MNRLIKRSAGGVLAAVIFASAPLQSASACTRILWNDNKVGVIAGRTMDWPESTEPVLTVLPRGMSRNGGMSGTEVVVPENPVAWTSKYGSLVTTVYGLGAADGLNEKGLAIHMLYLNATDVGPRDPAKPGLAITLWGQYVLDNAATVSEALDELNKVQLVMVSARGHKGTVHLVMERQATSAVVEYINGEAVVHHGKDYRIVTNDPTYDQQLALLGKLDFSKPTSDMPLPGNVSPPDRFQRASYYEALLPEPKNEQEAIAGVLAIARNVSVPFGAPYKGFGIYNTEYRTAMNLTDRRYFFELTTSPNVIWTDLSKFDLSPGAPAMVLDPHDIALSGDVSSAYRKVDKAPY